MISSPGLPMDFPVAFHLQTNPASTARIASVDGLNGADRALLKTVRRWIHPVFYVATAKGMNFKIQALLAFFHWHLRKPEVHSSTS